MTDPEPDATYPWLPSTTVKAWLKVSEGNNEKAALVEVCRKGAASWIEDQRPDLRVTAGEGEEAVTTFAATDRVVMAGLLATARLAQRIDSPNGVVSFEELGAGSILAKDPDIMRQLGRARPAVG